MTCLKFNREGVGHFEVTAEFNWYVHWRSFTCWITLITMFDAANPTETHVMCGTTWNLHEQNYTERSFGFTCSLHLACLQSVAWVTYFCMHSRSNYLPGYMF